jgi:hypothetical protein
MLECPLRVVQKYKEERKKENVRRKKKGRKKKYGNKWGGKSVQ